MIYGFSDFTLDTAQRTLLRSGSAVHLTPKAFQLLELLIEKRPRVLSKAEIHDTLWPETFVSESSLATLIGELRKCLDDDPRDSQFIRTVHAFGYGFCGEADGGSSPESRTDGGFTLSGETGEFILFDGENVIGRDRDCQVRLDKKTVSRRHARITLGPAATIEDLGSKNGTTVNGLILDGTTEIADGDRVMFGGIALVFRSRSMKTDTLTLVPGKLGHGSGASASPDASRDPN
jgi:DNA-binding winged helix-turn-helix (wHTH) protein